MNAPQPPRKQEESDRYALSVEQASDLFTTAGTPRSPRTIIRYCARGHLDCIKVDTEQNEKYLISRESIDRRIEEIRQVAKSSRVSTHHDVSGRDESGRDSDQPPASEAEESPKLRKKIESLESELSDQKIANQVKTRFIEHLQSECSTYIEQLTNQSRQIGQLETRLELQGGSKVGQLPEGQAGDEVAAPMPELEAPTEPRPDPPTDDPAVTNDLSQPPTDPDRPRDSFQDPR